MKTEDNLDNNESNHFLDIHMQYLATDENSRSSSAGSNNSPLVDIVTPQPRSNKVFYSRMQVANQQAAKQNRTSRTIYDVRRRVKR